MYIDLTGPVALRRLCTTLEHEAWRVQLEE